MENQNKEYLNNLRHSASHLLAAAVKDLYPEAKPTLGPPIEDGFYYDFDFNQTKISDDDLQKIEEKMKEIVKNWKSFERFELSETEAEKEFKNNQYKKELIEEHSGKDEKITIYQSGDFRDLCRGGHIEHPDQDLKFFKLLSIAGAYWRGSEKNVMLTRIYGTAFPTQEELDKYLKDQEEMKERDHRIIGKNLGLFVFSDLVGKGLPLLTGKGTTIRRELERFTVDEELRRGYQHVLTPPLAKTDLYKTSGHYPYYKDTMYPEMKVDEEELILRPMTCPHHFMLYKSQQHSYKELPLKFAEISPQYRYEKSGELSGLTRVRMFWLADAHIFATKEQAKIVIKEVLDLIDFINGKIGLVKGEDYRYRLSLGDREDNSKYYKDNDAWDYSEGILREVLTETNAPFFEAKGEAAFYGPKIDVQMKRASGKEETAFTVQYDFVMPKRFNLTYIDKDGKEKELVVIHRSSLGCFERTMAFLIEKYKGAFPVWLSPIQVKVLPITDRNLEYASTIKDILKEQNIRVEIDDRNEPLRGKIRDAQLEKIPYMIIIGDKETQENKAAVRLRTGEDLGKLTVPEISNRILDLIKTKALTL